jgi:hypothetical protein
MGSILNRNIAVVSLILVLLLPNCTSKKTLGDLGAKYEKANQAAVDAVLVESNQVKRVRRVAAVIAYINNPSLPITENINAKQINESFMNFVCTGADDFEITSAGLSFTSQYAKTVNAITTAPEDSIGGYINALSGLKGKDKPLALPEIKQNQFDECRREVEKYIPPKGVNAVPPVRRVAVVEAIAAVKAIGALIDSLQELVKTGLKMATEAEQRVVLQKFITKNKTKYEQVVKEDLSSNELMNAFERRRQVAVAAPYYAFEDMMKLSTATDRRKIIKRAVEIDQDLAEYDAIRILQKPAAVAGQFNEINQRLQEFADGKVSLGDIIQFLSETASELENAKKNYNDVAKNYQSLLDALKVK